MPTKISTAPLEVLIIEDEARIRSMLAAALREMNARATLTPSAEAGLKAMESAAAAFDVLILDLNLPGIGGIECLERIRAGQPDLQVIILTGFGDLDAARKAIHLDVVEFLTKPCSLGSLEAALDRARRRLRERRGLPSPLLDAAAAAQFDGPPPPPSGGGRDDESATSSDALEDVERRQILKVLEKHHGNRAATAAELGISLRKLYYRLGEYQKKGLL